MTTKEKARAYDKALDRAKNYIEGHTLDVNPQAAMEYVFPELAQSEDENIRRELIEYLKQRSKSGFNQEVKICNKGIAWLEKLGNIDKASYDIAEKEKREFVGDGFIKCYADFQDFKEGETYWLEYLGNDNYNVRSDNLLGKTYHIAPCQLYTIFKKQTWLEKQETLESIKLKEAGHYWHNEKKELRKIVIMDNIIKEDFVSFEVAKLLKEKGFDSEDIGEFGGFYSERCYEHGHGVKTQSGQEVGIVYDDLTNSELDYDEYLRPTLQMVMKWLREVYNINLNIIWNPTFKDYFVELFKPTLLYLTRTYQSYEEACEAAIKYSLENLI